MNENQFFDEHPQQPTPLPLGRIELPATPFVVCSHPLAESPASSMSDPIQTEWKPNKEIPRSRECGNLTLEEFLAALFSLTERYTEQTRSFIASNLSLASTDVLKIFVEIGEAAQQELSGMAEESGE